MISPMRMYELCNILKEAAMRNEATHWPSIWEQGVEIPFSKSSRQRNNATGRRVRRKMGPRRPGDPPTLVAEPAKAQEVLGWTAKRNLADIVSSAWAWMRKNSKGEKAVTAASPCV